MIKKMLMLFSFLAWGTLYAEEDGKLIEETTEKDLIHFLSSLKTKEQICEALQGKIVGYYDLIFLVQNCKLRPMRDNELMNRLIIDKKKQVVAIPVEIYRKIPMGNEVFRTEYADLFTSTLTKDNMCQLLEDTYISHNAHDIFYVEKCVKYSFERMEDFERHNNTGKLIVPVNKDILEALKMGKALRPEVPPFEKDPVTTSQKACQKFEGKIGTYFGIFIYVEKCRKREIEELSAEAQKYLGEHQKLIFMTDTEYKMIPDGKPLLEKNLPQGLKP